MDPFQFVVAIVGIVTAGGVVTTIIKALGAAHARTRPKELPSGTPRGSSEDLQGAREVIDHVSGRVAKLEEERDFYKDLLEAPKGRAVIQPPERG